jgi:hypothetical protein
VRTEELKEVDRSIVTTIRSIALVRIGGNGDWSVVSKLCRYRNIWNRSNPCSLPLAGYNCIVQGQAEQSSQRLGKDGCGQSELARWELVESGCCRL